MVPHALVPNWLPDNTTCHILSWIALLALLAGPLWLKLKAKEHSNSTLPLFVYLVKYGHMGICEKKIWLNGVSRKKTSKMQLRDVDLRSIGYSIEKLWPKSFYFRNTCNTILGMRAAPSQKCVQHCYRNMCNTILGMRATPF